MKNLREILGDLEKSGGIQITSKSSYFELFSICSNKACIEIPETTTINDNEVREWIFNKQDDRKIVRKNENKMNLQAMYHRFTGSKIFDYTYNELKEIQNPEMCAYVTFLTSERFLVSQYELKYIVEQAANKIRNIQSVVLESQPRQYLNPNNISTETLYCFAKREDQYSPFVYKCVKKCTHYNESLLEVKNTFFMDPLYETSTQENKIHPLSDFAMLSKRRYSSNAVEKIYYKSFDSVLNKKIEQVSQEIIEFFENELRLKVKHVLLKFMNDSREKLIFIGARDLLIFPANENSGLKSDAIQNLNDFETLTMTELSQCIDYPNHVFNKVEKPRKVREETTKVFSDKLYKGLIVQECGGVFCNYVVMLPDHIESGTKAASEIPINRKAYGKLQSNELPFQIPLSLIKSIHDQKDLVVNMLQKHKIFPPSCKGTALHRNDYVANANDYNLTVPKSLININNLYNLVHVCPQCLSIYSLMAKYLEGHNSPPRAATSYAKKKWVHTEVQMKKYLQSTEQMYPVTRGLDSIKTIVKQSDDAIHHNVTLFLHSQRDKKESRALKMTKDSSNSHRDSKAKLSNRGVPTSKDFIIKNNSETPRTMPILGSASPKTKIPSKTQTNNFNNSLSVPKESGAFLQRLSMGIVSKRENVLLKRTNPLASAVSSPTNMKKYIGPKSSLISANHSYLEFVKRANYQRQATQAASPTYSSTHIKNEATKMDILESTFGRKTKRVEAPSSQFRIKSIEDLESFKGPSSRIIFDSSTEALRREKSIKRKAIALKRSGTIRKRDVEVGPPYSVFHYKHFTVRRLSVYQSNIKKLPLDGTMETEHVLQTHNIVDFVTYRVIGDFPNPIIGHKHIENIYAYLHTDNIAIPFMILDSQIMSSDDPLNVIVVAHDFFDNFMEYIEIYQNSLVRQRNKRILLFNYPGQAYTIYPSDYIPTNEACSEIIDALLFRLESSKVLNTSTDIFNFVGYGYGGNILTCLLSLSENSIPSYKNLMLVNSFAYADDLLAKTLQEMIQIFEEAPDNIPELPYDFYSYLTQSNHYDRTKTKEVITVNPITKAGRVKLCQGCLGSFNLRKKVATLQMNKTIIHSLNNCFVNVSHSDVLAGNEDERYGTNKSVVVEINYKKSHQFVDGGHAIMKENQKQFLPKLFEFIAYGQIS